MARKKKAKKKSSAKKITAKPKQKLKSVPTPTFEPNKVTATWKYPKNYTSNSNSRRAEWLDGTWNFNNSYNDDYGYRDQSDTDAVIDRAYYDLKKVLKVSQNGVKWKQTVKKKKKKTKKTVKGPGPVTNTGQVKVAVQHIKVTSTAHTQAFDRSVYYPNPVAKNTKVVRYLDDVTFTVRGNNSSGVKKGWAKAQTSGKLKFLKPDKPTMSDVTLNSDTGKWSTTITTPSSWANKSGVRERYDTRYWAERKDTLSSSYSNWSKYIEAKAKRDEEFVFDGDLPNLNSLGYDDYIGIKLYCAARGLAGDSASVTKTRYFSYPVLAYIKGINVVLETDKVWDSKKGEYVTPTDPDTGDVLTANNGAIIVNVDMSPTTEHPVDKVVLQVLRNTTIKDPDVANRASNWQDVMQDNGSCTALADTLMASYPDPGKKVWYRLVTHHDHFQRVSYPYRATELENGVGATGFMDARVVDDGESPTGIYVVLGWDVKGSGSEIAWSTKKNAVHSDDPPATAEQRYVSSKAVTEERNAQFAPGDDDKKWKYSTMFYITQLNEGSKYYLSTRRFYDGDGEPVYGDRTYWKNNEDLVPITFAKKPGNVVLTVPSVIPQGSDGVEISWSFDSNIKQTSYELYHVKPKVVNGEVVKDASGIADTVETILRGTTETDAMFTTLTADEIAKASFDGKMVLRVAVSCGGPSAKSSNATSTIAVAPQVQLDISEGIPDGVLGAQNPLVKYRTTQTNSVIHVTVTSAGVVADHPDGDYIQAPGDVVYTGVITVASTDWGEFQFGNLELEDGCRYYISAIPVSKDTKLQGSEVTVSFVVDWFHQAYPPGDKSYVLGNLSDCSAEIHPDKPENWISSDVLDVYRVTPDGAYLIASGVSYNSIVTDRWAPYSKCADLRYRLCTRTADGDLSWKDVPYNIPGYQVRFDWGRGRHIELPYNLKFSDSWTKLFEAVRDLSGRKTGGWNPGVDRKSTLSTDIVRIGEHNDPALKEGIRELASYSGPIFVRTPNGCAFEANVNVTGFPDDYNSLVSNVTFDAEEIDLTAAFAVGEDDVITVAPPEVEPAG